jgi:hypothetical protein
MIHQLQFNKLDIVFFVDAVFSFLLLLFVCCCFLGISNNINFILPQMFEKNIIYE